MKKAASIKTVLVANRGEIACRIIRTCQEMGIRTVAVYSHVDRHAQHVEMADRACEIGEAPSAQSYLDIEKILEVCRAENVDAVHPGYGFLSENAIFAQRLAKEGIIFIGPNVKALQSMGDKAQSKALMEKAGVPLLGGYHGDKQDAKTLVNAAKKIGFPVLIKASAGGGGKGMRIVEREADFTDALSATKREALKSFGDDRVLIEKYLVAPRHIEVQVFGDQHGNIVHLFERDCSIQRRHQKVIEEAPAPNFSATARERVTAAAVNAAKAVDYVGAGTVEFLMDQNEQFYFMEMNTRLQVEHPVTEMITGLDLVALQIRVAQGETLPFTQKELSFSGHAIEARLYAEDPDHDFLPQAGTIHHFEWPDDPCIRMDSAVRPCSTWIGEAPYAGDKISVYYDPMVAKLIVYGDSRAQAVAYLQKALAETFLAGLPNNLAFLGKIAGLGAFERGEVSTAFIEKNKDALFGANHASGETLAIAAALLHMHRKILSGSHGQSWWPNMPAVTTHEIDGRAVQLTEQDGQIRVVIADEKPYSVTLDDMFENDVTGQINQKTFTAKAIILENEIHLHMDGTDVKLPYRNPHIASKAQTGDSGQLSSPMPATVIDVFARAGDTVEAGAKLLILEAMKMEHVIKAPASGKITSVTVKAGDKVEEGKQLVFMDTQTPEPSKSKDPKNKEKAA